MKRSNSGMWLVPALLWGCSTTALAVDEPAKLTAPAPSDALSAASVTVSGYLDVSYQRLGGTGFFANGSPDRVFDARQDSVTLHQAAITIANQPKQGIGALVNLVAGQDADVFAPYDINPGARSKFDFPQAYVQYATGPLTVIAGRFVTLAGYETIDPPHGHQLLQIHPLRLCDSVRPHGDPRDVGRERPAHAQHWSRQRLG